MKENKSEDKAGAAAAIKPPGVIDEERPFPEPEMNFEPWDEDTTTWKSILLIDAKTYNVEPLFDLPACPRRGSNYLVSPNQTFAYQNAIVPAGFPLKMNGVNGNGHVVWNDPIVLPTLVDLTTDHFGKPFNQSVSAPERVHMGNVWMSLSPNEILTQRPGVRKAKNKVLVGGLGLGWFLRKVCEKEEVQEVVVVEQSQELLDWYGYDLCRRYAKVSDVICDDVYNQLGKHGPKTRYLLDIWPCLSHSQTDRQLAKARKRLTHHLWAWGDEYLAPANYLAS